VLGLISLIPFTLGIIFYLISKTSQDMIHYATNLGVIIIAFPTLFVYMT